MSPPPSAVWVLDGSIAASVRRDRRGQLHGAAVAIPEGVVEVGPIGLQAVDRDGLTQVLHTLHEKVNGSRRAAVVIATGWVRTHLLEMERIPRRRHEVEDVVRWRLKKLLPVLPAELRLATVPYSLTTGQKQLLCVAGFERAFVDLEGAFAGIGVDPGLMTPRLFALARRIPGAATNRLIVQQEAGFLSLLLTVKGVPHLLRTKPLPAGEANWQGLQRELNLVVSFIRESIGVKDAVQVVVSGEDVDLEANLRSWCADQAGVEVEAPVAGGFAPGSDLDRTLGDARLAPVYALLGGSTG